MLSCRGLCYTVLCIAVSVCVLGGGFNAQSFQQSRLSLVNRLGIVSKALSSGFAPSMSSDESAWTHYFNSLQLVHIAAGIHPKRTI